MTAFNKAWQLVKLDYYFQPGTEREEMMPSGLRAVHREGGAYWPPQLNMRRESGDPSSTWHKPPAQLEKVRPMMLPRTMVWETNIAPGTKELWPLTARHNFADHGRVDHRKPPLNLPHRVAMNLSGAAPPGLGSRRPKMHNEAFERLTEDIGRSAAHETGHALIDDELMNEYERFNREGKMTPRESYDRQMQAHEIGAYSLESPGGWVNEMMAAGKAKRHPSWVGGNFPRSNIAGDRMRERKSSPPKTKSGWI